VTAVAYFGVRTSAYWTLEAREHTHDLAATASTLRELLADSHVLGGLRRQRKGVHAGPM
jgi:hypothetical protein